MWCTPLSLCLFVRSFSWVFLRLLAWLACGAGSAAEEFTRPLFGMTRSQPKHPSRVCLVRSGPWVTKGSRAPGLGCFHGRETRERCRMMGTGGVHRASRHIPSGSVERGPLACAAAPVQCTVPWLPCDHRPWTWSGRATLHTMSSSLRHGTQSDRPAHAFWFSWWCCLVAVSTVQ